MSVPVDVAVFPQVHVLICLHTSEVTASTQVNKR